MAERRMFAKTIIDSDAFLDMPLSAQALYFHLSMRADDEGFINNPKKIQRMVGVSDDDAKLLIAKKFIIPFDSGVVVIKHWKIHNYIQRDRFKQTVYQEEKSMLCLKENGAYSVRNLDTECIQDGYETDTQVRLGKNRLGKDSIGKDSIDMCVSVSTDAPDAISSDPETQESAKKYNYDWYKDTYNRICTNLTSIRYITDKRKKLIREFENTYGKEIFEELCEKTNASSFLCGKKSIGNSSTWKASFDFLLRATKIPSILEGAYDDFVRAEPAYPKLN